MMNSRKAVTNFKKELKLQTTDYKLQTTDYRLQTTRGFFAFFGLVSLSVSDLEYLIKILMLCSLAFE